MRQLMNLAWLCIIVIAACAKPSYMPPANHDDFAKWWHKIDSLESKALPRSALKEVEKLYTKAREKNEDAHTIKAVLYRNKYIMQLEEEGSANTLIRIETELLQEASPVREVLHSILGELYLWYAQNNAYQLRNRTETLYFNPEDLKTWSLERLLARSSEHYLLSVSNDRLNNIDIQHLNPVLTKYDPRAIKYVSNIQELLYSRAIEHFKNSVSLVTEPVYKFQLDKAEAFGTIDEFNQYHTASKDTLSQVLRAMQLYQKALSHYQQAGNQAGLVHVDLGRLNFANKYSTLPDKSELYVKALNRVITTFKTLDEAAEAYSMLATHWNRLGSQKNSKEELVRAADLCREAISAFPEALGTISCRNLLISLEAKSLQVQTEEIQSPDLPLRFSIQYKNLSKVYVKIAAVTQDQLIQINRMRSRERLKALNKLETLRSWNQALPDDLDYRRKSAEFLTDKLDLGSYVVVVSDSSEFTDEGHAVGYAVFHVSRLSYSFLNEYKYGSVLVTDNYSGHPKRNVWVEFYENYYDPSLRSNNYRLIETKKTDARGYALSTRLASKSVSVRIIHGDDKLDLRWNHYTNKLHEPRASEVVHIFTDRAIYRPGQIVYFKGLLMKLEENKFPELLADRKLTLKLMDANYIEKQSLDVRTSEFGSFHGSVIAPEGGLMGRMTLVVEGKGSQNIRVEEYKRPSFEVKLDSTEISYVLGDSVRITGQAKSYSGSPIDEAEIRFQVKRNIISRWRGYAPTTGMQLAYGTSTTDREGRFSISFLAKDEPNQPDNLAFMFQVSVDVLDKSGETRSASKSYNIGRKPFKYKVNLKGEVDKASLENLEISVVNFNETQTSAKGDYQLIKLKEPDQVLRDRYWADPDTILEKENNWNLYFPFESYNKKNDWTTWEEDRLVHESSFETSPKRIYNSALDLAAGTYKLKINASNDSGVELADEFFFAVTDFSAGRFPRTKSLFIEPNKPAYEPGETVSLSLGTALSDIPVWFSVEKAGKIQEAKWVFVGPSAEINVPVIDPDRGGFVIHFNWVKNNRYYSDQIQIHVPWSNKELNLEVTSFRDKLLPGEKEEWILKITGPKGEKIAAELLATMYDASLDAFVTPHWERQFSNLYRSKYRRHSVGFRAVSTSVLSRNWNPNIENLITIQIPRINFYNLYQYFIPHRPIFRREMMEAKAGTEVDEVQILNVPRTAEPAMEAADINAFTSEVPTTDPPIAEDISFSPRINLNETVFFFPDLKTDEEGNVLLSFKMNEALTRWRLLCFAHGKELEHAFEQREVVTQKDLMVFPNAPRFLRQGDQIFMAAKVVNLSEKPLSARVHLDLENAITGRSLDQPYLLEDKHQTLTIGPGQSVGVNWKLSVPPNELSALRYRVMAKTGDFTDGEENIIPVVSNRMMVTESLVMSLKANETKSFDFESMRASFDSETMAPHKLTLEYTSNPIWYAIQALPYIMEFPHECSEQLFNRYYANSVASHIVNQHPKIKAVFDQWKTTDKEALLSNLSKNQELKSSLLEETPWVWQAMSEEEQKANIALLFDLNGMKYSLDKALNQLIERQLSNGGFAWFTGGRDNPYISQYILEGFGHLKKLGILDIAGQAGLEASISTLIKYVDDRISEKYEKLLDQIATYGGDINDDHLDAYSIHYLYARSFFPQYPQDKDAQTAHDYYLEQAQKYWIEKGIYLEAMLALAIHRNGTSTSDDEIMKSLLERAILHDELGLYWKQNAGYLWFQLPVERQALLIEAAIELSIDQGDIDAMKTWLLKLKQTNRWKTTKSTAAAIYALLLDSQTSSTNLAPYDDSRPVRITIGKKTFSLEELDQQAGTGYVKTVFGKEDTDENMAAVTVENQNDHINWGALYWQYFEDLDHIKSFEGTPLTLKKQVFKVIAGDRGDRLILIDEGDGLQVGDLLKVRIELRVDRPMEFIHMKDMRASGLEPINVISRYKWQGGLGYYESTKDLASHFFIDNLPVGTFVFEYPLRVFHKGNFSNGITSIQSMYAPEFSSHSEGIRIEIE